MNTLNSLVHILTEICHALFRFFVDGPNRELARTSLGGSLLTSFRVSCLMHSICVYYFISISTLSSIRCTKLNE